MNGKRVLRVGRIVCAFLVIALLAAFPTGSGLALEKVKKILILPFSINAPKDLMYMREGILDMLGSRLAWEGRVAVVEKEIAKQVYDAAGGTINDNLARELAVKNDVDYVLFGSMTVLGESVSLDAKVVGRDAAGEPMAIHTQSPNLGGIISRIDAFAEEINYKVFARTSQTAQEDTQRRSPASQRMNPEKLLGRTQTQGLQSMRDSSFSAEGFWKSPSLPVAITGLDVGDVDGDNANEIVYSTVNEVVVGRFEDGRFRTIDKYTGYNNDRFITLDVADINGNGRAEVFVNCQRSYEIKSYVLEWSGGKLQTHCQGLRLVLSDLEPALGFDPGRPGRPVRR